MANTITSSDMLKIIEAMCDTFEQEKDYLSGAGWSYRRR